ncbi:MAG: HEAT repeat domain-containing protein [Desulfobulbaceae bacterium]|nr:HEAT repeat domain-containing protein [Desulfobulbaceae bacterium]
MRNRALKKSIISMLADGDLAGLLALQDKYPRHQLINFLIGFLCQTDEMVKWRAVTALGQLVAALADEDMEAARIVMRRFMWMLNDESGGIGWGVPEAMAEVMACHPGLADEYAHMTVANMREEGNFLELPMLQRGLLWGIGRLAGARPKLMREKKAGLYLTQYLDSADPEVRGRAVWAFARLDEAAPEKISELQDDPAKVTIYRHPELTTYTVGELARKVPRSGTTASSL